MSMEMLTPKAQGFLNHVKRIRVSRELSRTREGQAMRMRLILRYYLPRDVETEQ